MLLKEVRHDVMKEYRNESDDNLKPFLLDEYKKCHEKCMKHLQKYNVKVFNYSVHIICIKMIYHKIICLVTVLPIAPTRTQKLFNCHCW